MTWAAWMETADRTVAFDTIGPWDISTVFLGLDHGYRSRFDPTVPPLLFETMVFLNTVTRLIRVGVDIIEVHEDMGIQECCSTWDEAVAGHNRIANKLRLSLAS